MLRRMIFAAALAFAMFGVQACFYQSSQTGQAASTPPACDAQGNNCQSTTTKSSWWFLF
jgi:hypothetical protein